MKFISTFLFISLFLTVNLNAQWSTVGGNSMHNGQSGLVGILSQTPTGQSQSALFGSQIYAEGSRLVLMRFQTQHVSPIVCHNSSNGTELWSVDFPGNNSRSLPIGFRDNQVYAINFQESGNDTIYALNPADGSVIWRSNGYYPIAGILIGATYTSNGDLIMPESGGKFMRINKTNGQKMWSTAVVTPNTGAQQTAIKDSIIYGWTGTIVTPKKLFAMSAATGQIKYYSPDLPGDGDQEFSISIGPDGTIYALRDGGLFYALTDNGSAIVIKWSVPLTPATTSTSTQFGISPLGPIYVPYNKGLAKLDPNTGTILDTINSLVTTSSISPRITFTSNGFLLVSNGGFNDGALYLLDQGFNIIWSQPVTSINNSGPAVLSNYAFAVAGNGTTMNIYHAFVGITGNNSEVNGYSLAQNYPNPFNPGTSIRYQTRQAGFVKLTVFNSAGEEVSTLVNRIQPAGEYEISFDGSGLTSGVYFYRLETEGFSDTKKMLLVK
jgi:outer membrane protein assembly factor BamB